jgi:hypothetical protein
MYLTNASAIVTGGTGGFGSRDRAQARPEGRQGRDRGRVR